LPYAFRLKAGLGPAVSQLGRAGEPLPRGVKSGALAQFPPGRGASPAKPFLLGEVR